MSKETAEFLLGVLGSLTLNVGADDFDKAVQQILTAKAELLQIIGDPVR